jgi:hypothetical protein
MTFRRFGCLRRCVAGSNPPRKSVVLCPFSHPGSDPVDLILIQGVRAGWHAYSHPSFDAENQCALVGLTRDDNARDLKHGFVVACQFQGTLMLAVIVAAAKIAGLVEKWLDMCAEAYVMGWEKDV